MKTPSCKRAATASTRWAMYAFLALSLTCSAHSLQVDLDLTQYRHTSWTTHDPGLKGAVRTIAQTPDGYLWLGTEFGLIRFDGVRFVDWVPPAGQNLPSNNIRSLLVARDGALWIGTLLGLARWKDGRMTAYSELAGQNVLSLTEDRDGSVWAGAFGVPTGKLCSIHINKIECYGSDGSLGQWVWSTYEGRDGRLWAGAETGLWRWKPGPPERYPTARPIETSQAVAQPDEHGEPIAITEGLWQLVDGKMKEYHVSTRPGLQSTPVNMFTDSKGALWIGTLESGILRVHNGRTSFFGQPEGLSSDRVMGFFEDREHNVWVATSEGLDCFHEPTVVSISMKQGLSSPTVWSVLVSRDNSVWLSTLDGLNRWKDGEVTVYRAARQSGSESLKKSKVSSYSSPAPLIVERADPGLPDDRVGSLAEDERGRIWVSSPGGIARFEQGEFRIVREVPPGWVNTISSDQKGGVWISYQDHGLWHWKEDGSVEKHPWSELGAGTIGSSLLSDPDDRGVWIGFFNGGVAHIVDGHVQTRYTNGEGLGAGRVTALTRDSEGSIWASTEGGLSRLKDGRIETLTRVNGLPCNAVHWAVPVDAFFWLYTACGLLRIPRSEIDSWSSDPSRKVDYSVFDSADGVKVRAVLTGYSPHVSKSPDGRLWFSGLDRVSFVDTHDLHLNAIPPPVKVERVVADGKTYSGEDLRLPPRVRDLAIDYTALTFVAPEKVRFRYKLEGQDRGWREVLNDRKVQYSNLSPGSYRFRVMATNNTGTWNEQGDTLTFFIAPAYYQTSWFRFLCTFVLIVFVWELYQLRIRHLQHEFDLTFDARVGERTRIARELHDTLLQSFHGVLLGLQSVAQLLRDRPGEAGEYLEKTMEQAAEAITQARDAVQGLRDSTLQSNDLALAIRTIGDELVAQTVNPPALTVAVEGTTRILHPIVRDEIYKLAVESLRNAFRHAEARHIEAEVRYDHEEFRLRVRDDGKGIDPQVLAERSSLRHYGIPGMRERAQLIRGKLTVWSEVASGTEVELVIPAASAYVMPKRGSLFRRRSSAKV